MSFVVRSRVALIRDEGKSGSKRVAEVLPNQVVDLLQSRGKWIEVSYFGHLASEQLAGWALKKYFVRIKPSS